MKIANFFNDHFSEMGTKNKLPVKRFFQTLVRKSPVANKTLVHIANIFLWKVIISWLQNHNKNYLLGPLSSGN